MSSRDYPRLSIEEFGHAIMKADDLDPVYSTLYSMQWSKAQRDRWLLAYWLCYHPGAACWLSETGNADGGESQYWAALMMAAENVDLTPLGTKWPRAPERRHWRGQAAVTSVEKLMERYNTAREMVTYCIGEPGVDQPYAAVKRRVMEHYNFGDWIAYKVADMLERCCGQTVLFTRDDAMYDSPTKAAIRVWLDKAGMTANAKPRDSKAAVDVVLTYLLEMYKSYPAPGRANRRFGLQEAETVLCKWMSHVNGHYPPNNDLIEISAGVEPWCAISETARQFSSRFPSLPSVVTQELERA
jgi:hypothetical protein